MTKLTSLIKGIPLRIAQYLGLWIPSHIVKRSPIGFRETKFRGTNADQIIADFNNQSEVEMEAEYLRELAGDYTNEH
jgi:hypothetical protein